MGPQAIRRPAVAGTWYPGTAGSLGRAVDAYLDAASPSAPGDVVALVAPHAGLMYSGPVAAHAYRLVRARLFEVIVLVGPSHYAAFDGVASWPRGAWDTPLGPVAIAADIARRIAETATTVREDERVHAREHSLEMQLPFLRRVLPEVPIVPLMMGHQRPAVIDDLAAGLGTALGGRAALLVASSDLSHYHDAKTAARLDGRVLDAISRFDPEALQEALNEFPEHACGGGPIVAVMKAARALGARDGRVLRYADSGDVSGDKTAVVGYVAAAFGRFEAPDSRNHRAH
jgi:hypothetical protein